MLNQIIKGGMYLHNSGQRTSLDLCDSTLSTLKHAVNHHGPKAQMNKAIEETTELNHALFRAMKDEHLQDVDSIAEEIADVRIMLYQLELMHGCDALVDHYFMAKLDRMKNKSMRGDYEYEER